MHLSGAYSEPGMSCFRVPLHTMTVITGWCVRSLTRIVWLRHFFIIFSETRAYHDISTWHNLPFAWYYFSIKGLAQEGKNHTGKTGFLFVTRMDSLV